MESELSLERQELLDKLESNYQELVGIVAKRSEDELGRPPRAGEWSALQQLEHQIMTENVWMAIIQRTVSEPEPDLADLWATYRRVEEQNPFPPPSHPRSRAELLAALEERHDATSRLLESVPDASFGRIGRNTGFGSLTVLQMFRALYRHCRMHIEQIEGRETSFQLRRAP